MSAFFITATGTDIGKTFVAAGLIRHFRRANIDIKAVKPVVSGFDEKDFEQSDPAILLDALERAKTMKEIEAIAPWRYRVPLSPDQAAAREGKPVDFGALLEYCFRTIKQTEGPLLIEGVGGVMVPLEQKHTTLDLMEALTIPVLLVAGSYLGTISHTLTAFEALTQRSLEIACIVVNESENSSVPLADNAASIARFAGEVPVIALPRNAPDRDFAKIAKTMVLKC